MNFKINEKIILDTLTVLCGVGSVLTTLRRTQLDNEAMKADVIKEVTEKLMNVGIKATENL